MFIQDNTIFGKFSRFVDSYNVLWAGNMVPDMHDFQVEEGSCFDPASDMDAPSAESGFSYEFEYPELEEGFFCGM